jgi:hypothetical protein
VLTAVWQKWRFSAPQTHLWVIKVWFYASTIVVKIRQYAKPENVSGNHKFYKVMRKVIIIFLTLINLSVFVQQDLIKLTKPIVDEVYCSNPNSIKG